LKEIMMRKLGSFMFATLNGYFHGPNGDISWHRHGKEEGEYAKEGVGGGGVLLFGRVTYEMMAMYWPTAMALQNDPVMAKGMNEAEKIVFSRTLKKAEWNNTRIMKDNIVAEIKKLKQSPGKDMIILGSGSIVTLFAEHSLIDEYQVMVDPVVLGDGTPLFKGIRQKLDLKLASSRIFKSGVVLLSYVPMAK
jgi:dihydrofolate reductase